MNSRNNLFTFFAVTILIVSCKQPDSGTISNTHKVTLQIDDNRLANADKTPGDWLSYGRNYYEDHYSPLQQITKDNVKQLGLSWSLNLGTSRGIEATPLVVDGILYVSGPWSVVFAVDTRKAQLLWTYDPKVPRYYGQKACCDVVNRGVALYKGMIFVGSLDGRLIALDAGTGIPVWTVQTVDSTKPYTITGAPRIVEGNVIIGNGGADYGVRGYVTAYDALTGKESWRFYTVPGDPSKPFESGAMEAAAKTWNGQWWNYGGGGTAWDAMAYDPELKLLYIGTGNGGPWNRQYRSPAGGDNLYLSSIAAIDPSNGKLTWFYQTTPGDSWDYTATQPMILADMDIKGEKKKVIMQAPKNGFFYVIDRTNGKLISAKPYTYVNWAKNIDSSTGRPVENDFSRYINQNIEVYPHPLGAHNWQPMSYNQQTKLVYFTVRDLSNVYGNDPNWRHDQPSGFGSGTGWNTATLVDPSKPVRMDSTAPKRVSIERLVAWDPVQQKEIWTIPLKGLWNGGVMSTATGLVFEGTADGRFTALDAVTGKQLWEINIGSGIIGTPVSFEADGKQYVSIVAGWGGVAGLRSKFTDQVHPGTIYTFAIDGKAPMPAFAKNEEKKLIDLAFPNDKKELSAGGTLYFQYCGTCHGGVGGGGGALPDLAYSSKQVHNNFNEIVLRGAFLEKGMPNFGNRLSVKDVTNIQNYILATAKEKISEQKK